MIGAIKQIKSLTKRLLANKKYIVSKQDIA